MSKKPKTDKIMKKSDIKAVLEALRPIKVNKITDAGLKAVVIEDALQLAAAGRELDQQIKDAQEVILGAYKEESEEIESLRAELITESDPAAQKEIAREINGHKEFFAAQRDFTKKQEEILDADLAGLKRIDDKRLVKSLEKQEDLTLSQLEALYPLFILPETE